MIRFIDDDAGHFCWRKSRANESSGILIVRHDVDFLPPKLLYHSLNPTPFHAYTSPNGIDIGIPRGNGNLRSPPGFARSSFENDDAFGDFRDFHFKQPSQQTGRGTREDNLRP